MNKLIVLLTTFSMLAFAQHNGAPVQQVQYPYDGPSELVDYDTSGNAIFIGFASGKQPTFTWSVAATTLTNIVVLTNVGTVTTSTAHGLAVGNPVIVSGSATTALNATYRVASVPSSTTFTIATSGVGNATYTTGLVMGTTAPRSTAAIWAIYCLNYDATGHMTGKFVVNGVPTANQIWANRATLTCQ